MKPHKLFAAFTALVLAASNSAAVTPTLFTAAEETIAAAEVVEYCTAKISVVDIRTEKSIDGIYVSIEQNPYGTGLILEQWDSTDTPVKTIGDLNKNFLYGIHFKNVPDEYELPYQVNFSFDYDGETKDIVVRAVPKDAPKKVFFEALDWTNAELIEETGWFRGYTDYKNYMKIDVYDEKGNYFLSSELLTRNYSMYLPDGKYKIKLVPGDRDYEVITDAFEAAKPIKHVYKDIILPDKDGFIDVEVVNGALKDYITVFLRIKPEVIEYTKDGCKADISIVDMYTNEPLKGVKARFVRDPFSEGEMIAEWDTTDEPTKFIKDLSSNVWYEVRIVDAPAGYHIDKKTSFNFSELGDTKKIVIRAVPQDKEPNINIAVYDWTDLVVNPSNGTYEGYKPMDPKDYSLYVFTEKYGSFNMTERDIHLPDGEYMAQILFGESVYSCVDKEGYKARAVRKIFGEDFVVPDGISLNFEIKDGVTVGQPCFFVEKKGSNKTNCTLDLKIIDGITGKPADAAEYKVIRIDEQYENSVEEKGLEDCKGFMHSYGDMPESGEITVNELEPFVKYVIVGSSGSKRYGGAKLAYITFDKDGEKKEVTIRLMPFDFKGGDVNGDDKLNVADLVLLQRWLLAYPDTDMKKPEAADLNEDGNVDMFDLIQLRKELLKSMSAS